MKKFMSTVLAMLLCVGLLSGCGTTLEGEDSVVYVDKKGTVYSLDVEALDQDYYDSEELEEYVNEAVSQYTSVNGSGSVKVNSLTVENGVAKLSMKYKTAADYTSFNGIELYQGNIVDALAAGYVFDGDFAKVEEGNVVGSATKQEIYEQDDLKVVIIRANTDVKIEGEICYVSCENVKLTGADSVSIRQGYYLENGATEAVAAEVLATEQVEENTESVYEEMTQPEVVEDGAFETEVYTFIIYK